MGTAPKQVDGMGTVDLRGSMSALRRRLQGPLWVNTMRSPPFPSTITRAPET